MSSEPSELMISCSYPAQSLIRSSSSLPPSPGGATGYTYTADALYQREEAKGYASVTYANTRARRSDARLDKQLAELAASGLHPATGTAQLRCL